MNLRKMYTSWDEVPVLMTMEDVSIMMGLTNETVRQMCLNNTLPARQFGRKWLIDKNRLKEMFGYN